MSRLKPQDLQAPHSTANVSFKQVRGMLEHYGFICRNETGGSHFKFQHREFHDLYLQIPYEKGSVHPPYVVNARDACLEVKQRNKERREAKQYDAPPDWLESAFPHDFAVKFKQNVGEVYSTGADAPQRSYEVYAAGGSLHVRSLDYPDCTFDFTMHAGDHKPYKAFQHMFTQLDATVCAHLADNATHFNKLQETLLREGMFRIEIQQKDGVFSLHQPLYDLHADLLLPTTSSGVSDGLLDSMEALRKQFDEVYYEQMHFQEKLKNKGWRIEQTAASGNTPANISFHYPGKENRGFSMPLYGELELFALPEAKKIAAEIHQDAQRHQKPRFVVCEPVEIAPLQGCQKVVGF